MSEKHLRQTGCVEVRIVVDLCDVAGKWQVGRRVRHPRRERHHGPAQPRLVPRDAHFKDVTVAAPLSRKQMAQPWRSAQRPNDKQRASRRRGRQAATEYGYPVHYPQISMGRGRRRVSLRGRGGCGSVTVEQLHPSASHHGATMRVFGCRDHTDGEERILSACGRRRVHRAVEFVAQKRRRTPNTQGRRVVGVKRFKS